ncbi:hypothetical protein ABZS94_17980 [Streptomyces sp. NPDC005500]|uniref:hypothetical protein n=1 Tax=Streptomyces sp. NPDC005500 TaxID=3155007 RepID=UPI0033A8085D
MARLMLPDCDFPHLAIPRPVDGTDDPQVRRLKGILQSHATMLREALFELRYQGFVPEVDVEVRLVPFAPQMKLYILNRRLALQGFYVTEEGTIPLPPDREEVAIYDAYGTGATLVLSDSERPGAERPAARSAAATATHWKSPIAKMEAPL